MKKLGFLLSHFGDNELAKTFIKSANDYLNGHLGADIIAFVNNQEKPISHPSFASMNINEVFDYDGTAIATDIDTAEKLLRCPGPRKRCYYIWETNWHKSSRSFDELIAIFNNKQLTIIAKSEKDRRISQLCWNITIEHVIPDCNMEAFVEMICKDDKK